MSDIIEEEKKVDEVIETPVEVPVEEAPKSEVVEEPVDLEKADTEIDR